MKRLCKFPLIICSLLSSIAFGQNAFNQIWKGPDCFNINSYADFEQGGRPPFNSGPSAFGRYIDKLNAAPTSLGILGTWIPAPQLSNIRSENGSNNGDSSVVQVRCDSSSGGETSVDYLLNTWATDSVPTGNIKGGPQIFYTHSLNNFPVTSALWGGRSLILKGNASQIHGYFENGGKCEVNLQIELTGINGHVGYAPIQFNLASHAASHLWFVDAGNDGQSAFFSAPAYNQSYTPRWFTVLSGTQYINQPFSDTTFAISMNAYQLGQILESMGLNQNLENWGVHAISMYVENPVTSSGAEASCSGSFRKLRLYSSPHMYWF